MSARRWLLALALWAALPAGVAGQVPVPPAARRQALEQQVMQRFLQRTATELRLSPDARARLGRVLRESAAERRTLNQEAVQLRRRVVQRLQDPDAADAEFEPLLEQQRQLREREHALWEQEQERLREVLSPRQLAHFSILWFRLQEDARALLQQRAPRPGRMP